MIVFFRHGKTVWNLERRLQGQENNSELLPVNEVLIEKINTKFKNIVFDKLFISPSKRVRDYIEYFDLNYKQKIIEPSLNEIAFGVLSGHRLDEIEPEILKLRNKNKWYFRPKEGESYNDLFNRLEGFCEYINSVAQLNIAIAGHETCNKVLIGKLLNFSKEKILGLKQPNECIYKIDNNELYRINIIGDEKWEKL